MMQSSVHARMRETNLSLGSLPLTTHITTKIVELPLEQLGSPPSSSLVGTAGTTFEKNTNMWTGLWPIWQLPPDDLFGCSHIFKLYPAVILLGAIAVMMIAFGIAMTVFSRYSKGDIALSLGLTFCFQDQLSFMLVLVDSLDIARRLGQGTAFSGWIIGAYKVGGAAGQLFLWSLLSYFPSLWRRGRSILMIGGVIQFVGVAFVLLIASIVDEPGSWPSDLANLLLVARAYQGFGGGLIQLLVYNQFGHLVDASQRPARMLSLNLSWALGLGLAPLLSAFFDTIPHLIPCEHERPRPQFQYTLACGVAIPLGNCFGLLFYPDIRDVKDFALQDVSNNGNDSHWKLRVCVILTCLVSCIARAFIIAAWEASLTMLLEVMYGIKVFENSVITSIMCFSCVLVKLVFDKFKANLSLNTWIRILSVASLVGGLLCRVRALWAVLMASFVLFPTVFMTAGLYSGIAQNHAMRGWFGLRNVNLALSASSDLIGRGLGPPVARIALSVGFEVWWFGLLAVQVFSLVCAEAVIFLESTLAQAKHEGAVN